MKMNYEVDPGQIGQLQVRVSLTMTFDEMDTVSCILGEAKNLTPCGEKTAEKLRTILSGATNKISSGARGDLAE